MRQAETTQINKIINTLSSIQLKINNLEKNFMNLNPDEVTSENPSIYWGFRLLGNYQKPKETICFFNFNC